MLDVLSVPKLLKSIGELLASIGLPITKEFKPILVSMIITAGAFSAAYKYVILPIKETAENNLKDVNTINSVLNSRVDGYLIPIAINFDKPGAWHSFRLPINSAIDPNSETGRLSQELVALQLFSGDELKELFKQNLIIEINGDELDRIGKYFSSAKHVKSSYFDDSFEKKSYEISLRLKRDMNPEDFQKIRFRRISLLITHRSPVLKQARGEENLPD